MGLFDDSKIVGYTFLVKRGNDYLVDYLAVNSDSRNNGAGSEMVQLLVDYLKNAGNVWEEYPKEPVLIILQRMMRLFIPTSKSIIKTHPIITRKYIFVLTLKCVLGSN